MADIVCPRCKGKGAVMVTINASGLHGAKTEIDCCPLCDGDLTIPDRRSPTANDRAVERIKAWALGKSCNPIEGYIGGANDVLLIIQQESERDG